jgi:uncharacterized protein (DUF885 family)
MGSSRREFLFNSAAVLALGVISRPVSAAQTPDARLEKLFDRLFEGVLEISPQLAVTLGRDSGSLSQSRMRLDDETPDGQARRAGVPAAILAGLRKFDPSGPVGEIGYYGWRAARARALGQAGHKYDLASFHDQGLKFGPLPRALLDRALFCDTACR